LRLARFGSGIGHQNQRPSSVATDGVTNDRMMKAAGELAADGYANPDDVDKVWRIATDAPLGPFQIYDAIGLITPYNILSHGDERDRQIAAWLKENYIDAGKLGVATGEGFYRYTNDT
jgi:3-hydroxyacyl-CoA dehydrogenase